MPSFTFFEAVSAVESWLDGAGSSFATRVAAAKSAGKPQWDIDLRAEGYPVEFVRVSLGPLFPALPCELYVSPELCLEIPHIEEDGRVCLGEACVPEDFVQPVAAVTRAITRFKAELLERCSNQEWRESQLHEERLSYWSRFCDRRQKAPRGRPRPRTTFVSVEHVDRSAEGQVVAYIPKGSRHRRFHTQVITLNTTDPSELAARHMFNAGTVVKGSALFVRLPTEFPWTPSSWPQNFVDLTVLVQTATDGAVSLTDWLMRTGWHDRSPGAAELLRKNKIPDGTKPLVVVLCHGHEMYGYQISQSTVSYVTAPHAAPIKLARIDPSWSLTRDQAHDVFNLRQQKRILVLGAGSLGSPIIEMLARSGIGTVDVVDSQLLEAANVSRHALGLDSVLQTKASALASRIRKQVPGVCITGFASDARTWCVRHSTPGKYDLILDLTAESSVRSFLAHTRKKVFGDVPLVHAWVEPYCAAAHVVATLESLPWPSDDSARTGVNVADYSSAEVRISLPACSDGFHPYGSADITQAAGFAAERILAIVDEAIVDSTVWSFVRTKAFFDALGMPIITKPIVPSTGGPRDGVMLTRLFKDVLKGS